MMLCLGASPSDNNAILPVRRASQYVLQVVRLYSPDTRSKFRLSHDEELLTYIKTVIKLETLVTERVASWHSQEGAGSKPLIVLKQAITWTLGCTICDQKGSLLKDTSPNWHHL